MKTYAITLDDIHLLADAVSQLDYVKQFAPPECAAESARLVTPAHEALSRILGDDDALVYALIEEEETRL